MREENQDGGQQLPEYNEVRKGKIPMQWIRKPPVCDGRQRKDLMKANQSQPSRERLSWIDTAKGLSILSVVMGHAAEKGGQDAFLLRLSMFLGVAAFFFLSGATFELGRAKEKTPVHFLRNLGRTLVVPYFAWAFLSILVYGAAGEVAADRLHAETGHYAIVPNLLGMLYGNSNFTGTGESGSGYMEWNRPLWFLTCLFIVKCSWYLLLRVRGKRGKVLHIAVFAGSVCTLVIGTQEPRLRLPWEAETAAGVLWIFGLGVLYMQRRAEIEPAGAGHGNRQCRGACFTGGALCVVLLLWLLVPPQAADFRADRFTHPLLTIPEVCLGICAILCFARALEGSCLLTYAGERTMAILVMHKFVLIALKILGREAGISRSLWLLVPEDLVMTAAAAAVCLLSERILAPCLPWLFGKRKGYTT